MLMRFPDVGGWKIDGEVVTKKARVVRGLETLLVTPLESLLKH
jgi:hypothetical protein